MSDCASRWLIARIAESNTENSVWFSDENILPHLAALAVREYRPLLISNRWDVAQQADKYGFTAQFSDFDCSAIADNSQDTVFYRISKEKPVTHYIINQSFRILKPGGTLIMCGQKSEGIKTFIEKAGPVFNSAQAAKKDGINYHACLQKNNDDKNAPLLDDSDYSRLRMVTDLNRSSANPVIVYSKPGLFGWNKIDQGSALLIAQFQRMLPAIKPAQARLLDLGCGYGYLSLMTANLPFKERVLTDNNAAALIAAKHNCAVNSLDAKIVATDAGTELETVFDLILCNPPFHQGFSADGDLTDKFLAGTKRLLAKNGMAVFVVNQFIPLERKAQGLFGKIEVVTQERGFKIVKLML